MKTSKLNFICAILCFGLAIIWIIVGSNYGQVALWAGIGTLNICLGITNKKKNN